MEKNHKLESQLQDILVEIDLAYHCIKAVKSYHDEGNVGKSMERLQAAIERMHKATSLGYKIQNHYGL